MTTLTRWLARGAAVLGALLLILVAFVWWQSSAFAHRVYDVQVEAVALGPVDSAMFERGRHLVDDVGLCRDCHGPDLGGQWIMDDPAFARLQAANITPAGAVAGYTDADWVRLLRHGVKPNGRSAVVMPSESYRFFSDADLAALVGYLRSVPPVEGPSEGLAMGPMARVLTAFGPLRPVFIASVIQADTMPRPAVTTPDTSAAYGYYLAQTAGCIGCHGPTLAGGPIPGGDPDSPPAANITPGGIASWDFATFARSLREGVSPGGRPVNTVAMPLRPGMTDRELRALWSYLRSIPARSFGG